MELPGAGVTGRCEPLYVGAGNLTLVFNRGAQPLNCESLLHPEEMTEDSAAEKKFRMS